jgi:hypothetical protein
MSVYMGEEGSLLIKRTTANEGRLRSSLDPDDVNVARKRFSFDFPVEALNTGDRIEIYTLDGSELVLVAGHNFPDGRWYCHIDDTGGIRLYDDFEDSINGKFERAIDLVAPPVSKDIIVQTRNSRFRCYGQMRSWEITTSRQTVDTTALGEEFLAYFSKGLISGQGSIDCIWDYKNSACEQVRNLSREEQPNYLCELLLRLKQGALFRGQFFLYAGSPSVWYEADCIVTNVGLSFAPGEIVGSRVDFVTTGPIDLHTGDPESFLTQEDSDLILQEDVSGILLEDPS